tara:strand:- start:2061 stop:2459 length:399 start_codon:yes stop_codon:yes gene_type:complete
MDDFYDKDMLCTYPDIDEDLQDDLYKIQFLQIFKLNEWDDNIINDKIEKLFNLLNENNEIKNKLEHVFKVINDNDNYKSFILMFGAEADNLCLFKLLFSYDLFSIIHMFICDFFNKGVVEDKYIFQLIDKLN